MCQHTSVNIALEMIATLICVNHLFCKKYYFRIHDAVFILSEIIIIESANYLGLSKGMALFGYIGIYIYELVKFKCSIRMANVNLMLFIIFGVVAQIFCSIPALMLEKYVDIDILMIGFNSFMVLVFWGISRKGRLLKVSRAAMNFNMLINIATGISFAGAVYILVVYKLTEYMRVTDYIIFGMWTILIGVLIVKWQQEKFKKIAEEKEIELRNTYEEVHKQLLETIRKKQHDFNNQINAVYSLHIVAKDYDELVSMQKNYCGELLRDNRYSRLLSGGSPIIIGFLYSKFMEAERKGCSIEFDVKIDKMICRIPQYKIVEILGILLDNAIEAVAERESKGIYVKLYEVENAIYIVVKNDSEVFSRQEFVKFIQPGYSTKGKGRGTGLAKLVEMLKEYDCELNIYFEKNENTRIVFMVHITE